MTTADKVIKTKVGVLELGKQLGNVSKACRIMGYSRIHEIAYRPWQSDNIPRRYCTAEAMLNDGKPRPVYFSIIEDGGFASYSQGVEWCVVGLDRDWAYNPACRAARP